MTRSLLGDAFAHHVWATFRVLDSCAQLTPEQLETTVPGTYGSILDTLRHVVGADCGYLFVITGQRRPLIDEDALDLAELRREMETNAAEWRALVSTDLDPDRVIVRQRDDGGESHAPVGIRLAQAIHHGTDHRSQVCTALTSLGIEPPEIDVWDFGADDGRVVIIDPPQQETG